MLAGIYTESFWSLGWMPKEIELEFHSKDVSDFQMSRLVRASLRKYNVPITAFISDAMIADDTCFGVSFDHSKHDDAYHRADGSILITGKIQSARKEGRFWLLETQDGNYVIASFKRGLGRASFIKLLKSADRL